MLLSFVVILIYVDDLIIGGDSKSEIQAEEKFGNAISYEGFGRAKILSWY